MTSEFATASGIRLDPDSMLAGLATAVDLAGAALETGRVEVAIDCELRQALGRAILPGSDEIGITALGENGAASSLYVVTRSAGTELVARIQMVEDVSPGFTPGVRYATSIGGMLADAHQVLMTAGDRPTDPVRPPKPLPANRKPEVYADAESIVPLYAGILQILAGGISRCHPHAVISGGVELRCSSVGGFRANSEADALRRQRLEISTVSDTGLTRAEFTMQTRLVGVGGLCATECMAQIRRPKERRDLDICFATTNEGLSTRTTTWRDGQSDPDTDHTSAATSADILRVARLVCDIAVSAEKQAAAHRV